MITSLRWFADPSGPHNDCPTPKTATREWFKAWCGNLAFFGPAELDEGTMRPTSWAITELSSADEKIIAELVRKAVEGSRSGGGAAVTSSRSEGLPASPTAALALPSRDAPCWDNLSCRVFRGTIRCQGRTQCWTGAESRWRPYRM